MTVDSKASRRFKDYTNTSVLWTIDTTNWLNAYCINMDSTNQDESFWIILKWDVQHYWSNKFLIAYNFMNNIPTVYNFNNIDDSWVQGLQKSVFIKKWNRLYQFRYYHDSPALIKYNKYSIWTVPNSSWVYELARLSTNETFWIFTWWYSGNAWWNEKLLLIIRDWFFIFWQGRSVAAANDICLNSYTVSFLWNDFQTITQNTWNTSTWQTWTTGNLWIWLHNYKEYINFWAWHTSWWQQINWKFVKLNSSWEFISESADINGIYRVWNELCTRTKLDKNWVDVRISWSILKYYDSSYSLTSTSVGVVWWVAVACPVKSLTTTNFRWIIMTNFWTEDATLSSLDNNTSTWAFSFPDLEPSKLLMLTEIWNDTWMLLQNNGKIQIFTVSEVLWWTSFKTWWDSRSYPLDIDPTATYLVYNKIYDDNAWISAIEILWDETWSRVDVTSLDNTNIAIPVPWTTSNVTFKITMEPSVWLNSSPIYDKIIKAWFK